MSNDPKDDRLDAALKALKARMELEGVPYEADHSAQAEQQRRSHVGRVSVRGVPSAAGTILGVNIRTVAALGVFGALSWWFLSYDPVKGMDLNYRALKIPGVDGGANKAAVADKDEGEESGDFIPSPPYARLRGARVEEEEGEEEGEEDEDEDDVEVDDDDDL